MSDDRQEILDRFYHQNGPCCAGCDWWNHHNSLAGECRKSAPVSGRERLDMLGIYSSSAPIGAGHPLTRREHRCGDFKDSFDWSSLPLAYLKRVNFEEERS